MKAALCVLVLSLATTALARDGQGRDRNERREARQEARIQHGQRNGELTKREARRLKKQQHHIDRAQEKAEADGVVTDKEKMRLEKMQDRASKNIYKQKHDGQERKEMGAPEVEVKQ